MTTEFEVGDLVRCTSFPDVWQVTEIVDKHIYAQSLNSEKRADFRATSIWPVYTFWDLCHAWDDSLERRDYRRVGEFNDLCARIWGNETFLSDAYVDYVRRNTPLPQHLSYLYNYVTER